MNNKTQPVCRVWLSVSPLLFYCHIKKHNRYNFNSLKGPGFISHVIFKMLNVSSFPPGSSVQCVRRLIGYAVSSDDFTPIF